MNNNIYIYITMITIKCTYQINASQQPINMQLYFCFCLYLQFADDRKQTGQVCDKVQHQKLIYNSVGSDIDISHVDIRI